MTMILSFNFLIGVNLSGVIVTTLTSSKVLSLKSSLILAASTAFLGPLILGTAVANALSKNLFNLENFKIETLIFALISAIIWNLVTWYFSIPSSASHALIGALIGASLILNGINSIKTQGLYKIVLYLLLSPIIGYLFGFINTKITKFLLRKSKPDINIWLKIIQIPLSIIVSLGCGANDSQKATSLMALTFFILGIFNSFRIPYWMLLINAAFISLGIFLGGKKIIKTLGAKIYKIRPLNGFSSQFASATIILISSLLGGPVSSTHIVTASIAGSGGAERINKIKWSTINKIIFVMFFTIPITMVVSMSLSYLYRIIKG